MIMPEQLDDESFEEILENNKKKIPQILSEWTDFNEHDPGLTFLELFSWFQEMQQFYLDQVGQANYYMFLKLLGIQIKRKKPVYTNVVFSRVKKEFILPRNSKIYAKDIAFETVYAKKMGTIKLLEGIIEKASKNIIVIEGSTYQIKNKQRHFVFGDNPQKGDSFLLKLDQMLEKNEQYSFYFQIYQSADRPRNPISQEFIPFVTIQMEFYSEYGFIPCQILEDETYGFLYSGYIRFYISQEMQEKDGGFQIRFLLKEGEYDIAPEIEAIEFNAVPVVQRNTLSDFQTFYIPKGIQSFEDSERLAMHGKYELYLERDDSWYPMDSDLIKRICFNDKAVFTFEQENKEGLKIHMVSYEAGFDNKREYTMNGFPCQKIILYMENILYDGIEILAENPYQRNQFNLYQRVENFHNSTKTDRHYTFDTEKGIVTFGDCEKGMAPSGKLLLLRCITSEGKKGNIKKYQLTSLEDGTIHAESFNFEDAFGGEEKETMTEAFQRFQTERMIKKRAVTLQDYEEIVQATPGLCLEEVRAIPSDFIKKRDGSVEENTIFIAVKPYSHRKRPKLLKAYYSNIYHMLEDKRLLGCRIQLLPPEYIGVSVYGEIIVKPHYTDGKAYIQKIVEDYFKERLQTFGTNILHSRLYGVIDGLDCVIAVKSLSLTAVGRDVIRNQGGDLIMPANAIPYLAETEFFIMLTEK